MEKKQGQNKSEAQILYEKVISNDYCIGCGVCTVLENSPFKVRMDDYGNIIAFPYIDLDNNKANVLTVCPFSDESKNEDELGDLFFSDIKNKNPWIGKYIECFAGYVSKGEFRKKGSSGGVAKWLGYILLKEKKIDYFVQVVPNTTNDPTKPLFEYAVISSPEEVLKGSKSAYYPVTLSSVLHKILHNEGKYAITGLPCFIKALRLISLRERKIKERIKYTIGIVCGGMKSANQAKLVAWQLGMDPQSLTAIDYRRKHPNKPASHKIFQVWSQADNIERYRDSEEIFATGWGGGYFKPNACDFCDDVVNETADISVGDAWLPQFEQDPLGTSLIIIRKYEFYDIFKKYIEKGILKMYKLSAGEVVSAQSGGFRQKREGLSYRIAQKEREKKWYPPKRVKANQFPLSWKRKKIYILREKIAQQSHLSFKRALDKNDLGVFYREIKPLVKKYYNLNYGIFPVRILRKIKQIIFKLLPIEK